MASAVVSANVYRDLAVKSTLALNGATLASKVGTSVTTILVKVTFTQPVNPATVTAAAFSTMNSTVGGISVAANGYKAPGVVVSFTNDPEIQNSKKFLALGLQTAAGVPLQCDEPADFMTFRIGLFGLEKLHHIERSLGHLSLALDQLGFKEKVALAA